MQTYQGESETSTGRGKLGGPTGDPIQCLRDLLGHDVLMLSWPNGSKGTHQKWGHLTIESMSDPEYLATLRTGNIGVALGERSGGLCTIDIDRDEEVEPFLALNPNLSKTLRTRGNRGCNLWFRASGVIPRTKTLTRWGDEWGELRGAGGQTIIYGLHPNGQKYRIVNFARPISISIDQIRWPEGMPINGISYCTERTELTEQTEPTDEDRCGVWGVSPCFIGPVTSIDQAVELSLPTGPHQNHDRLFKLARAVKALETMQEKPFTQMQHKNIFNAWHQRAAEFLRSTLSKDDYWFEYLEAYENAIYPLGQDVLSNAWQKAKSSPLPPEALGFESPEVQLLVALCGELQRASGAEPFYLSCRTVQRLFGHKSHTVAAFWLNGLVRSEILKIAVRGGPDTGKASRFFYLPVV